LPVLVEELPQGLDVIETERRRPLRESYLNWSLNGSDGSVHDAWIASIIHGLLEHDDGSVTRLELRDDLPKGLSLDVPEHGETIVPAIVIHERGNLSLETARVLVFVVPPKQRLDRKPPDSRWTASVNSRAAELCRSSGVRLGLVTNGEQWVVIDAPADETVGYATWHARLWLDEPVTLDAFAALLGRHRLFSVADDQTLEGLLDRSREDQHEVTDQLGLQVRRAVEMLVRSLDRADQDLGGDLLKELEVGEIYEAAVTVMMRLVFLFSAEERGLLLLGDPLFDEHYAVSTLCEQLREVAEQHGEEILERRRDAWCRLLAAFRAVHSGVRHDRLQIPAYGGGLFDPDRFPFLEGRQRGSKWQDSTAEPLPVDNRTVLHCLESLQYLQTKIGKLVESRRLSFRALDIEQIGHVYEGLLDHTAARAIGPTLGLYGRVGDEPEVELAELESLVSQSRAKLVDHLAKLKVKASKKSVEKLLNTEIDSTRAERLRRACRSDELWNRVEPFAVLVRDDDFGQPIIIHEGQLFATQGQDRSDTGTQYTPRSLTEPVVEHSLEPLVYIGPAEGKPREEWQLRTPKEILDLKVCDMACGSGAFLVQACRYLGDRLVESWAIAETKVAGPNPGKLTFSTIHYDGSTASGERDLVPKDEDYRLLTARRLIAQRCIYGVDINPVAAEMAKLSIWLLTLSKDKPFSFLDHAIRSGDALLGLHDIRQLQRFSLDPESAVQTTFSNMSITELIEQASGTRLQIEQLDSDSIGHVQVQARLLGEVNARTERLRFAADMLISGHIQPAVNAGEREDQLRHAAIKAGQLTLSGSSEDMREYAHRALLGKRPFHWCLEFPEILARGGFDAIVGNPPFKGGKKLTGIFGSPYREYLVTHIARGARGNADLVAYFLLRVVSVLRSGGYFGLIATNTAAQGETREVGLRQTLDRGVSLYRAISSRPWPGAAGLEVAQLWGRVAAWNGPRLLDGYLVSAIPSSLSTANPDGAKPHVLPENKDIGFQGSIVLGMGFVLDDHEAASLIAADTTSAEVIKRYLNGEDLMERHDLSPSRWVIDFADMPLKDAEAFVGCMARVRSQVKPERAKLKDRGYREKWWQFGRRAVGLYNAINGMDRVLVMCKVAKHMVFAFVPSTYVYSNRLTVFAVDDWARFGALQSDLHDIWARTYSATLETRLSYTPTDCFETFPLPHRTPRLEAAAHAYYQQRAHMLSTHKLGLTSLYNRFHNPADNDEAVCRLRELRTDLNIAVLNAYGWADLVGADNHGWFATRAGERFNLHPALRDSVLDRLREVNRERYSGEAMMPSAGDRMPRSTQAAEPSQDVNLFSEGAS